MARIDSYLKRLRGECDLSYLEDIFEMYSSVPNPNLQVLFATYHTQLNQWFSVLNEDIRYQYDEKGNRVSLGGYFHAGDSRAYLSLLDQIDRLRSRLSDTPFAFSICDTKYSNAIAHTRRFVMRSGGSTIPEDFPEVEIQELQPIFQIKNSVSIIQDTNTIFANLKYIAEGSYAKVSYYIDPVYNIPIAVKQALPNLDDKELVRFRQEYDVLKNLHSPYIVTVYAYNSKKNEYTMEFMDETIQEFIGKYMGPNRVNLSLLQRKNIIRQVCRGFQYIHNKGLLHRDISLTNVFIKHYEDTDVVKIGDFGLVKIPESNLTSVQTNIKGSLNDPDLIHVGFANYEMCHEIFALTRLCTFILTGMATVTFLKKGKVRHFWEVGTNVNRSLRYRNVSELWTAIQQITEEDFLGAL